MSFAFDWASFSKEEGFLSKVRLLLTDALNRSTPRIIEGPITVKELNWGDEAPSLEILEIGDVASDRFRGIFKLNYSGSASITLGTKVQANLLNVYSQTAPAFTTPKFVGAPASLSIPLNLTLSDIELSGIVILVFSKARGLTLVFRNDPLVSIKVSSTFDSVPGIAPFLQNQIETQIRGLFREELPAILYRHSQQWTPSGQAEILAQMTAAASHQQRQARLMKQQQQLMEQLQSDQAEYDLAEKPVTFAELDPEKQVSLVNILHIHAMTTSRRTLGLSTPTVATAVLRSELCLRHGVNEPWGPVSLAGEAIYEHVHHQADRIASRSSHQPRRRVIKLHHNKSQSISAPLSPVPAPSRLKLTRASSVPVLDTKTEMISPDPTSPIEVSKEPHSSWPIPTKLRRPMAASANEIPSKSRNTQKPFLGASFNGEHSSAHLNPPPAYVA